MEGQLEGKLEIILAVWRQVGAPKAILEAMETSLKHQVYQGSHCYVTELACSGALGYPSTYGKIFFWSGNRASLRTDPSLENENVGFLWYFWKKH